MKTLLLLTAIIFLADTNKHQNYSDERLGMENKFGKAKMQKEGVVESRTPISFSRV